MARFLSKEDRYTFLGCLLISFIFWMLTTLSKEYAYEISLPVSYINLPEDKVLVEKLEKKLAVSVRARGSDLLRLGFFPKRQSLVIDYEKNVKQAAALHTRTLINQFEDQFGNIEIRDVSPPTIYFAFEAKKEKKVPLVLDYSVSTPPSYEVTDELISTQPDSVTIAGPAPIIDTLKYWKTRKVTHKNLQQTTKGIVQLLEPATYGITLGMKTVNYQIDVEQYTEKRFDLPVNITNLPDEVSVFLHPQQVEVVFQVKMSRFEYTTPELFSLVADFSKVNLKSDTTVPIGINSAPHDVRYLRLASTTADFLIIKD